MHGPLSRFIRCGECGYCLATIALSGPDTGSNGLVNELARFNMVLAIFMLVSYIANAALGQEARRSGGVLICQEKDE